MRIALRANLTLSRVFYEHALAPLGMTLQAEFSRKEKSGDGYEGVAFGPKDRPLFWIGAGEALRGTLHVAFVAADRDAVVAFYKAALAAGGTDNGAPGLRPHYHSDYYAAFVLDPDGHNIEAVCQSVEQKVVSIVNVIDAKLPDLVAVAATA